MKRPFFISRATWAMIQEARRTPNYSWFDFLHGYIYLRWPYFYIGVGTGEHPLAKAVAPVANWLIERLGAAPHPANSADGCPRAAGLCRPSSAPPTARGLTCQTPAPRR